MNVTTGSNCSLRRSLC